jgi:hypothetical protein
MTAPIWEFAPLGYLWMIGYQWSDYGYKMISLGSSMVASAGETDQDLAATQFTKNCVAHNIIEF